jgi:hypothetical protein
MARVATDKIVDVDAMPERRHGRRGVDLEPLIEKLRDLQPHAIENVASNEERARWRRRLRRAARTAELAVETRYVREERRLYFRGVPN